MTDTPSVQAVAKVQLIEGFRKAHKAWQKEGGGYSDASLWERCADVALALPLPPPSATATEEADRIIQRAIETEPGRQKTITVERALLGGLIAQALDARTAESEQEMGQVIADAFRNGELAEAAKHADCCVDRERTAQMEQQLGFLLAEERRKVWAEAADMADGAWPQELPLLGDTFRKYAGKPT